MAALTILSVAWKVFDVWSNLEFIGQKAGLVWRVLHFLFATQTGANIIVVAFVALFVGSLLFQIERTKPPVLSELPPPVLSESPAPPQLPASVQEKKTERPNLVFKGTREAAAHLEDGVLRTGLDTSTYGPNTDLAVTTLYVENEFSNEFKVTPVSGVTAQLFYYFPDGAFYQVNRGAWLDDGNRMDFKVNDRQELIVAFTLNDDDTHRVAIVCKEYDYYSAKPLNQIASLLNDECSRLRVKLISETEGVEYADREFDFEISRDPVAIELTPSIELSTEQICQRLERFLGEGNDLLKDFPKEREKTKEDDAKIDAFERRVTNFLARYPDRFSVAIFLSDVPAEKYHGGPAHSCNWPSLNRLTTRIARLRDMIDEVRRA